jgi:hypothetical protein
LHCSIDTLTIESILATSDFEGIDIVDELRPHINKTHDRIFEEADRVLQHGIETRNQAEIAVGLQVFYNLKHMAKKANDVVNMIIEDVVRNIKHVVNMQSIQKEVKGTYW